MSKPKLTVCLIAKNEEPVIGQALASISAIADEIILVDTGSTDATVAIAEGFNAQIIHFQWQDDFSAARNVGLEQATGDWILVLDADERVSSSMAESLPEALLNTAVEAYLTKVVNYENGQPISSGAVVRLFRNRPSYRFQGRVHEQVGESIISAGGAIVPLPLEIEHYGYTPGEDTRKNRRNRNLELLQRVAAESPGKASTWYFLGLEHSCLMEYGSAVASLTKAYDQAPTATEGVAAAHHLAEIELDRNRVERTWRLVKAGSSSFAFRLDSLVLTARLALLEEDYLLASKVIQELRGASPTDFGQLPRSANVLDNFEALALWISGRREQALTLWDKSLALHPSDGNLAANWVRHLVTVHGLSTAVSMAVKSHPTLQVASACVGALLRAGELDQATRLSTECLDRGWLNNNLLYGALRAGEWHRVETKLDGSGLAGAVHLATAALWFDQPDVLERAFNQLSGSWRTALERIVMGEQLSEDLFWVADLLMSRWAEIGCLPLVRLAAQSLPKPAGGNGRAAWLLFKAGITSHGLELALSSPEEPDSLEVLGLAAFANSDWEAAAFFLTQRLSMGVAPVGVYHKAATALIRQGNKAMAQQVLELGRSHRPDSALLRQG